MALARAVAVRPRVLLLDEPLTALDAQLKVLLRDEMADLLRQLKITAVHVTHDQQEALAIADRLAVMRAGRIVQVGQGESLYRHPAHPFVAEFLGRVNRLQQSDEHRREGVIAWAGLRLSPLQKPTAQAWLVRPEDIVVGAPQEGWGVAQVQQRLFLGEQVQLRLSGADQQPLLVLVASDCPARPGDRVGVWIDSQRLIPSMESSS